MTSTKILLAMQKDQRFATDCENGMITRHKIDNIKRRFIKMDRIDSNDLVAIEKIARQDETPLLLYQRQEVSNDGKITQDFMIAFASDIQLRMLKQFGNFVFLDATNGLNYYGYVQMTLLVKDAFGASFPVAFCIAAKEDGSAWETFIKRAFEVCISFTLSFLPFSHHIPAITECKFLQKSQVKVEDLCFMMDKGAPNIKAMKKLGATYHLCHFHMMQDWDRKMKVKSMGVHDNRNAQNTIKGWLKKLQFLSDKKTFLSKEKQFMKWLENKKLKGLKEYYDNNWGNCSEHWASHGKAGHPCETLHSYTNNAIESFFNVLKYKIMGGRKRHRLESHIKTLIHEVIPLYVNQFIHRVQGSAPVPTGSGLRHERDVHMSSLDVDSMMMLDTSVGEVVVQIGKQTAKVVLGDLSCNCQEYSCLDICIHIEAAVRRWAISPLFINNAASRMGTLDMEPLPTLNDVSCLFLCSCRSKDKRAR